MALGLLSLSAGCTEVVSGVDADAGSVTQFETTRWGGVAYQTWFLLVVDDAPTEAARRLRQRLAQDLPGFFDELDAASCGIRADPGQYRPIDLRLVVVGASGTLEPRFRDEEGLHAFGVDASPDLLTAFEGAGRRTILDMETSEVLPFVGELELVHYLNLSEGKAEPRSSAEADFVQALPAFGASIFAGLAKTRADTSAEGPALHPKTNLAAVRLLDWPEDGTCPHREGSTVVRAFNPIGGVWTSPDCFEEARLFDVDEVIACRPTCMSRLPATDASGRAACRVYGEFPIHVDCETAPGWTFLRSDQSTAGSHDEWSVNLCELRQAEGATLDACVHDFACEDCEPSFCFRRPFTARDEGDPAHRRPTAARDSPFCELHHEGPSWERLRIVHGADQVNGLIRVVCQE